MCLTSAHYRESSSHGDRDKVLLTSLSAHSALRVDDITSKEL